MNENSYIRIWEAEKSHNRVQEDNSKLIRNMAYNHRERRKIRSCIKTLADPQH